jgi:hypothetical protein
VAKLGPKNNPYQSPAESTWVEPVDQQRRLTATFEVGRQANDRVVRLEFERQGWFLQGAFVLQLIVFLYLMAGLVYRWPMTSVLVAISLLVVLNLGQLLFPHWATRRRLAACQKTGDWPIPWGGYELEVTPLQLIARRGPERREWRLADLARVLYLGNGLLIVAEPGVYLLIPREADFGQDTFSSFVRLFAIRFRQEVESPLPGSRQAAGSHEEFIDSSGRSTPFIDRPDH